MKQLLFKTLLLLFFLPTTFLGQSGEGYINYKSYKTHYGSGAQVQVTMEYRIMVSRFNCRV